MSIRSVVTQAYRQRQPQDQAPSAAQKRFTESYAALNPQRREKFTKSLADLEQQMNRRLTSTERADLCERLAAQPTEPNAKIMKSGTDEQRFREAFSALSSEGQYLANCRIANRQAVSCDTVPHSTKTQICLEVAGELARSDGGWYSSEL